MHLSKRNANQNKQLSTSADLCFLRAAKINLTPNGKSSLVPKRAIEANLLRE
jgi:hypothetical protein